MYTGAIIDVYMSVYDEIAVLIVKSCPGRQIKKHSDSYACVIWEQLSHYIYGELLLIGIVNSTLYKSYCAYWRLHELKYYAI